MRVVGGGKGREAEIASGDGHIRRANFFYFFYIWRRPWKNLGGGKVSNGGEWISKMKKEQATMKYMKREVVESYREKYKIKGNNK